MAGISVPPVPQGVEYGGLCRRRHNARAECRAAPALFRRPAQYDLPSEIVLTPHGAPPRLLCLWAVRSCEVGFGTRAVVCVENMRRTSASAVCGTKDGTAFSAAFGSGGCARICGAALLFPSRRFRAKKANWKAQSQRAALYLPMGRRFCFALSGGRVCRAEAAAVSQGGAAA